MLYEQHINTEPSLLVVFKRVDGGSVVFKREGLSSVGDQTKTKRLRAGPKVQSPSTAKAGAREEGCSLFLGDRFCKFWEPLSGSIELGPEQAHKEKQTKIKRENRCMQ
eukprot:6483310-Amphidinium_carterae.1